MITKFLARDLVLEINIAGTFTHIGGIESLSHSPASNKADTADYDSNGRAEHLIVERGDSWSISGFALEDVETGARDPGQEAVIEAGKKVGLDSLAQFRMTSPGGNAITYNGSVEATRPGGGHNDLAAFAFKLDVSGEVTYTGVGESGAES